LIAINELLDEKKAIEEMLKTLGYDSENKVAAIRRGKTAKEEGSLLVPEQESPAVAQAGA
jgi:hypothetical protein